VNKSSRSQARLRLQAEADHSQNITLNLKPSAPSSLAVKPRYAPSELIGTFTNPILNAPAADPWVFYHEGFYYYCESRNQESIFVRRAKCFTELREHSGEMVWTAPATGRNSKAVWAPELHLIGGKWFIYYAADDGLNENHRMWVLEGLTNDPLGPYRCRGALETGGWAIDGTVLQHNGSLYFVWSGWPGKVNGQQNLYIAPMSNPWTVSGERTLLAAPEHDWEKVDMAICEGPQILKRDDRLFIVYSASGSWTVDYCLGLLEFRGGDILDSANWFKHGCAFKRNPLVWGLGHCSFVQSQDGTEDWIVYHAKSKRKKGWNDRQVHAQRFTWSPDGLPHFGNPLGAGVPIPLPASAKLQSVGL
jgi:GH43 family beta-xylosidase